MTTKLPLISCLCAVAVLPAVAGTSTRSSSSTTTTSSVESMAQRELARREEAMSRARELINTGDRAMKQHDYETAFSSYKEACDILNDAPETRHLRSEALDGLCEAACNLAEQRIGEGRYADAETTAKAVLDEKYDPHCHRAIIILAHLEDPDYYNKTITPKFRGNVEEVKKLLKEAEGFYDTGRFDMSFRRYEQVLNLDPYNIAARKGQEKVNKKRDDYAVESYNHTRSYMNWQVDQAWNRPVRRFGLREGGVIENTRTDSRGTEYITNKLNRIIIPKIEFREATVREAIDFLKQKSRELDTEQDPTKRGVNIVLKMEASGGSAPAAAPDAAGAAPAIPGLEATPAPTATTTPTGPTVNPADVRITLSLSNIPLAEALRYITNLANLKIKVDPFAVAIVPITENTADLVTKEYKVPPGFIGNSPTGGASSSLSQPATGGGAAGAGASDTTRGGQSIAAKVGAKDFLESQGVLFPPGASANYLPSSSKLVVRNTQDNLDLVDILVDVSVGTAPTQVEIESKFVEITQNNLKELGFDLLLGQQNVPGSSKVFISGGTPGTGAVPAAADFPQGFPTTGNLIEQPVTSGLRSGNLAISANAIDALLFPTSGASRLAPGIFGIGSTLTDPTFQLVIRALNQKKGVDLLSAPRVTTKSGQRAVIEIIREFRYPTEFDPPQIPQNFGSQSFSNNPLTGASGGSTGAFPVTPTTPTAFETRNTGVTLEVEPTVGPDGYTIDLNLVPQVVEFEGFINYGSPIKTISPLTALSTVTSTASPSVTLTDNVINQPIFSTRKVTTSVSIWDGQTVVLGGLMREDVQKVEDKVPILGDLPLFGRLFRNSVDQHLKRNLIIFVSARLINPAGETVLQSDEKEEVVEAIGLPQPPAAPPMPEAPLFQK
ncbi:MAG: ral secretion pathway protein [Chthoniobacter sp.]|nr:ral secretion pathway protein [Chthoniobacter sp.]